MLRYLELVEKRPERGTQKLEDVMAFIRATRKGVLGKNGLPQDAVSQDCLNKGGHKSRYREGAVETQKSEVLRLIEEASKQTHPLRPAAFGRS